MTPDPHPDTQIPNHAHIDGRLVYDQRCWWCRDLTAQPPPTARPKGARS